MSEGETATTHTAPGQALRHAAAPCFQYSGTRSKLPLMCRTGRNMPSSAYGSCPIHKASGTHQTQSPKIPPSNSGQHSGGCTLTTSSMAVELQQK